MRRHHFTWLHLALCVFLILSLVAAFQQKTPIAVAQQGQNLLQNGGFEGTYVAVGGDPSLQVAPNWQPWNLPPPPDAESSAINLRPDYQPASANRVRSGNAAQEYNTFFATHDGGVYQRVPVSPGAELQFTVFVYVWSSATFEDPNVSSQPQDVDVQVGIDPLGGQDGGADDVIWSDAARFYDEYRELSITGTAQSNAVTVFVRSNPKGSIGVNNIYLDDAALVQTGQGEVTPTAETATAVTPSATATTPTVTTTTTTTRTATASATTATASVSPSPSAIPSSVAQFPNRLNHTVVAGDTVSRLAALYRSSIEAIIAANGLNSSGLILIGQRLVIPVPTGVGEPVSTATPLTPTPSPTGGTPATTPTGGTSGTYVVQLGDSLYGIAVRFNTTVEALATLNNITNPNRIVAGTILKVPGAGGTTPPTPTPPFGTGGAQTYVVQVGDNLFRIALRFNVTVERLMQANRLLNANLIFVGQALVIPQ